MAGLRTCRTCGATLPAATITCPACGASTDPPGGARGARDGTAPAAGSAPRRAASTTENPFATELNRRLARLAQWSEAAEPLGVGVPHLPAWAQEAAARTRSPEPWAEVVRAVERLAQRRIAEAFDRWEERTNARIGRLEAYSVDSRLEHSQVEDAVHAARLGDIAQALATFQQVDRVVSLKERHLDQARGDLEHLLAFLRDLEALGLVDPGEPAEVATELERELRTGRLASLKQRLRLLRSRAVTRTTEALPEYVARLGDRLATGRPSGAPAEAETRELAVAVRSVLDGRAEEGIRRLRALTEARGLARSSLAAPRAGSSSAERS